MTPKSGIVWIASFPKSGNTWIRAFLHNLSRIMAGEGGEQDINDMSRFTTWDLDKARYTRLLGFEPNHLTQREEIASARHAVQREIADAATGLVFIKTHNALVHDRGHTTINFEVTAGAIYAVRNPLDVAVSYSHHMGRPVDAAIEQMAQLDAETHGKEDSVYEVYGSWSQNVWSWTRSNHPAIYMMRYEDMLADPDKAFGNLARHLLLTPTPQQLAEAIAQSSFKNLRAQEATHGFRERAPNADDKFFREGRAGEWKEVLTRAQIDRIVNDHGEQMQRLGYLPLD